ncbi:hypothetical protein [Sulfurimonas sp.]
MDVLKILGFIIAIAALYALFEYLNNWSLKRYKYEFYSVSNLAQVIVGYWIIYFGNNIYTKALKAHGDLLNGQLLIAIGVIVVLIVIYRNFKAVALFEALLLTLLELLICIPLAIGAFIVLIVLVAALSETKPVYVINN